jgi:hypothetical protein
MSCHPLTGTTYTYTSVTAIPFQHFRPDGVCEEEWDHLPKEMVSMITVKVVESSHAPPEEGVFHSRCRQLLQLESHYQPMVWGERQQLDMYLQTVDWLQGANNIQTLFVMGMGNNAVGGPMVWHFSHDHKMRETYMHLTCWPSSSTTSMAPSRMYSTTSDACMVSPLLVCRSEDGGQSTKAPRRTVYVLSECATEHRRR